MARNGPCGGAPPQRLRRGAAALLWAAAALSGAALPAQAQEGDPRAPSNLSARVASGAVHLDWDAPAEDAAAVTGYEILRRRTNRGEGTLATLVSDTGSADTAYVDATATDPGVRYAYRVRAIRGSQRSDRSNYATVMFSLPLPSLVGNLGQAPASAATINLQYAMGFRLGKHGQGYEIDSVSIDLAAVPTALTVSLWMGTPAGAQVEQIQRELFTFANPASFQVGPNQFTAPEGAYAYPNVNYWIVLSGFTSISIMETASDDEDAGGEAGAVLWDGARTRALGSTGRWVSPGWRGDVLRVAVEGRRRDRGILASTFGQPTSGGQENVSAGDNCCFDVTVGAADRYLIRGVALEADDTTVQGSFFGLPFQWIEGSDTLFSLAYASAQGDLVTGPLSLTAAAGISEWTAPRGATVAGGKKYELGMAIVSIDGDTPDVTRGGVTVGRLRCGEATAAHDEPTAPGVTLEDGGNVTCPRPIMAVDGEALWAMVSNVGQTDASYLSVTASASVASQAFSTGGNAAGYLLQGIGVNVEGSDDMSTAQVPDGPGSVSVALHAAASSGKPGAKLHDLVSPDLYGAGEIAFFEAPRGTELDPNRDYVVVWTHLGGTGHRLRRTSGDGEDSGALADFAIANAFHSGNALGSLSASSGGHALEIQVYGEAISGEADGPGRTMVSNLQQTDAAYIEVGPTALKVVSQAFTTGPYSLGYGLRGIDVNIEGSDDMSTAQVPDGASSVSLAVHAVDSDGKPDAKVVDLISADAYEAGETAFFAAPPGAKLSANTTYAVVWSHLSGTNHRLQPTSGDGEDPNQLPGFSIADDLYSGADLDNLSVLTDTNSVKPSLGIAVHGDIDFRPRAPGGYQVTRDWLLLPGGVKAGDQFRVVFYAGLTDAASGDIEDYNAIVREIAAKPYNDRIVRSLSREFRAVACTAAVSARENTGMTDRTGVPVHWLYGGYYQDDPPPDHLPPSLGDEGASLIAPTYDQFYSGRWRNAGFGAWSTGNAARNAASRRIWTGCDAGGAALPDFHLGSTSSMGKAAAGTPNGMDANLAPIGPVDASQGTAAFDGSDRLLLYAVSPVLTVVKQ